MESHEEQAVPAGVPESEGGVPAQESHDDAGPEAVDEAGLARDLVLRAYPDVVPELIAGESVAEMLASVPAAREAYQRVVEAARASNPAPEPVPAGGGRATLDVESMSPALKIRMGLGRE